jgi:DNA-binding transcriptional regulator YdaS (Cro superfamily)
LGCLEKKVSPCLGTRDTDRVRQARADYQARIAPLEACRFKFIDESGVNLAMTRRFGRAPRPTRVVASRPQNYGTNITLLGALSAHGIEAVMSIEGPTDGQVFCAYLAQGLCPTLVAGDVVVMDNLSAHKSAAMRKPLYATGAYSYREIAQHFGIHPATVGRIVRRRLQRCES